MLFCKKYNDPKLWYWNKSRNVHQWNRIESSEINSLEYGLLIRGPGTVDGEE